MALDAGAIAGIVTAVTTLIGAIATFIYKVRGKSWREVATDLMGLKTDADKELAKAFQEQTKVIKAVVEKEIAEDKNKKKK